MFNLDICRCKPPKKKYSTAGCELCWVCENCGHFGGCDNRYWETTMGDKQGIINTPYHDSDLRGPKPEFDKVNDSGKREEFATGSVRDTEDGKGCFDLIPALPLRRLAIHYQNGASKDGRKNWMRGQRLGRYLSSAERHIQDVKDCKHDEDHLSAIAWNAFAFMWTAEQIKLGKLPRELDDVGWWDEMNLPKYEPKQTESNDNQVQKPLC
jgi:hypothetical protein